MEFSKISLEIALVIVVISAISLFKNRSKGILYKEFAFAFFVLLVHIIGLILQIYFKNGNINPIYFDYISYTGAVFHPVALFLISISYSKPNADIKKYLWVAVLPIISLLVLWTNDLHHLFYIIYSINMVECVHGIWFFIHTVYSYGLLIIAFIILIYSSVVNSGFFSKQTFFIVLGGLTPLIVNVLGTFKLVPITIYLTPILFIVTAFCFSLAIIKYKALNIVPIAYKTIMDIMSDSFIVISNDGTIVEMNKTLKRNFNDIFKLDTNDNFFNAASNVMDIKELKEIIEESRSLDTIITKEYHIDKSDFDKYFEVDIHPIKNNQQKYYIGTLLLFKDITQHKKDIETIEQKQEVIIKQEQLVSIGELAGGVAHDINTPISAIKTGILMLNEMSGQRTESERNILQRMDNCATKIINIVNSMRNQIRNLGGDTNVEFKISSVVSDIKIITYHEVFKNKSEVITDIKEDVSIKGDPTKLGQVLTNLIVNASQAYDEKGGKVDVIVSSEDDNAVIKVRDYAGGLDENIRPYVFKNILTTKGTNGTGLGLYLAYSVIKGNFNGEISFETETNVGTTFIIKIPKVANTKK